MRAYSMATIGTEWMRPVTGRATTILPHAAVSNTKFLWLVLQLSGTFEELSDTDKHAILKDNLVRLLINP